MFPAVLKAGAFQFHFVLRKTGWKEQIQRERDGKRERMRGREIGRERERQRKKERYRVRKNEE